MGDIVDICQGLPNEQEMLTPMIDVDCSNACFKIGKNVQSLARHLISGPILVYVWYQCVMLKSDPYANRPQTNKKLTETETRSKHPLFAKTYVCSTDTHI